MHTPAPQLLYPRVTLFHSSRRCFVRTTVRMFTESSIEPQSNMQWVRCLHSPCLGAQSKSITRKETTISTASSSCTHARHGTFHSELSSLFCCISVRGALPEPREGACCQGGCRIVAPSRSWFRGLYARLEMIFWSPHIATPPLLPHKFSAALPVPTTS